jgi:hypothetical protein
MKIKFVIKRMVDGALGFCFMQVHFAFKIASINEGKRWKVHYLCYIN